MFDDNANLSELRDDVFAVFSQLTLFLAAHQVRSILPKSKRFYPLFAQCRLTRFVHSWCDAHHTRIVPA